MRRIADYWWLVGAMLLVGVLAVSGVVRASQLDRERLGQRAAERQTVLFLRQSVDDVLARERALARVIGTLHGDVAGRWPALASIVTSQPVANSSGFIAPVTQREAGPVRAQDAPASDRVARRGRRSRGARRPVHFVLTQAVQKGVGAPLLGLDLAANPLRRALLLQAARTGGLVATPPVRLLSDPAHPRGVIVYQAVRDARGLLLGWVTATYEARRLAAMVTARAPDAHLTIHDGATVLVSSGRSLDRPPRHDRGRRPPVDRVGDAARRPASPASRGWCSGSDCAWPARRASSSGRRRRALDSPPRRWRNATMTRPPCGR